MGQDSSRPKTEVDEARKKLRAKWKKWAQAKRDRMTPEQIAEARAKAKARRAARLATPEGRQKHLEQDRRWRAENADKVARHREKEKEFKRLRREAERASRLSDPAYLEQQALKELRRKESEKGACKRYYQNRKERLAADPEAMAAYRALQKKHRENKKAKMLADPTLRDTYLEALRLKNALRPKRPKAELTDKEKEEKARRRRERRAKAQRLINAKKREEREARKAEEAKTLKLAPAKYQPPIRKMGRLTALLKWHGR